MAVYVAPTFTPLGYLNTDTFLRIPRSSYYDKHYRQSAALIRARQPYLVRNIVTGTAIFAFAISVCMLSNQDYPTLSYDSG